MTGGDYQEELKQKFIVQAELVFERIMAEEGLTLSEIEERVNELRFELTSELVESKLKVEVKKQQGPADKCPGCGREMRDKGVKKRTIMTTQGEIEIERSYNYCAHCREGFFPPGPTIGDQCSRLE